jgi:hypothetical protein
MQALLFKTSDYAFLDFRLFEDLPLEGFQEFGSGQDIAERLVALEPALDEPPRDLPLFRWFLMRLNHLSSGRLTLDAEHGDEGYFPLTILVTKAAKPVAALDFESSDYGIHCFTRGTSAEACEASIAELLQACTASYRGIRNLAVTDED